jgi:hypothetical protein
MHPLLFAIEKQSLPLFRQVSDDIIRGEATPVDPGMTSFADVVGAGWS